MVKLISVPVEPLIAGQPVPDSWANWFSRVNNDTRNWLPMWYSNHIVLRNEKNTAGIYVDQDTPSYPWHDMIGEIRTRGVGATDPNDAVYRNGLRAYQFAVNDEAWMNFHILHDYVPGSDLYFHWHWSHNVTTVTGGSVTWAVESTYAKGHDQAAFPASVTRTLVANASTTQYQHLISETQLSTSGGSATQLDSDNIEVDGLMLVRVYLSANNITVSSGGVPDPFLHFVDVHYQSTGVGTKNKAPNFWT